jgi:PEP-CTERM motif
LTKNGELVAYTFGLVTKRPAKISEDSNLNIIMNLKTVNLKTFTILTALTATTGLAQAQSIYTNNLRFFSQQLPTFGGGASLTNLVGSVSFGSWTVVQTSGLFQSIPSPTLDPLTISDLTNPSSIDENTSFGVFQGSAISLLDVHTNAGGTFADWEIDGTLSGAPLPEMDGPLVLGVTISQTITGGGSAGSYNIPGPTPEPATLALGAVGAAALLFRRRK